MKKNYPLLLVQELTYIQPEGAIYMYIWQVTGTYYNICIVIKVPGLSVPDKFECDVICTYQTIVGLRLL